MEELDIFAEGETIDLCIPTKEFARDSNWYSWFNDPGITRYLDQGKYPNTREKQEEFLESQKDERLILIISTKGRIYKGVVSLNFGNTTNICNLAIVTDFLIEPQLSPFAALEAVARISEHGFEIMGLKRISAGQHIHLVDWQQRMELLGYRIEGIQRNNFIKGQEVSDTMSVACLYEDYASIVSKRGALWDSMANMKERIHSLPSPGLNHQLSVFLESEGSTYYREIFEL